VVEGVGASEIRSMMTEGVLSPSRALGQNFLTDPNISEKIAHLAAETGCRNSLEIGPGLGSLTVFLASYFDRVVAIDLDRYVIDPLHAVLRRRDITNVEVVHADALNDDIGEYLEPDKDYVLAANLPYNVASHLIVKVLERYPMVGRLVFMVQHEVGQRICATVSSKDYSALSVKVRYFGDPRVVMKVPPSVFVPKPKVNSVVVLIDRCRERNVSTSEYNQIFALVRTGFSHRRQMLRRSLQSFGGEKLLEAAGLDPTLRAENLDVEDWIHLGKVKLLESIV